MAKFLLISAFATCLMAQLDNGLADALHEDIIDDAAMPPLHWSPEANPEDPVDKMLFISFRHHCLYKQE